MWRDATEERSAVAPAERGVAMRVLALDAARHRARCAGTDGVPETVETALVRPLELGAVVLVHRGVALARLDTEWAL